MQQTPRPQLGRVEEYARAKRILDLGRHPTFIGRETVERNARNGGLIFFQIEECDAAVSVVNPRMSSLLVLCVLPAMRGKGVGQAIVNYLRPNFVRAIESAVPFFERLGYRRFGTWKQGRKFRTGVMMRGDLKSLASRVARLSGTRDRAARALDLLHPEGAIKT